jgi:large subunit ribosomal protein L6
MSRIGKLPIQVPSGVTVEVKTDVITVKGPKSELKKQFPASSVEIAIADNVVNVKRKSDSIQDRAAHGLVRALTANMIRGVTKGFEKRMEIKGVGYRIALSGKKVTLNLGFSHPIEYVLPEGIELEIDKENKLLFFVRGADKQVVGEVAAKIRSYRPPEPYKGKGIRYSDERVVMKQGKAASAGK